MPEILKNKTLVFLFAILAIAAFFRLWQLNNIPPGLYPDVALNGNEALQTLKTGDFKLFYPENNGREGLMMWLIALSFQIFGVSIWSIKIVAALAGILTVLGLYFLVKELLYSLFNIQYSKKIALLASFFLATSFWHTDFSRIGFRAILLPLVLVFSFYFLFRGWRTQKLRDFIFSGIIFGLGFYTYTSFRMAVLILPFAIIPYWFIYQKQSLQKKYVFLVSCFLLSVFVVALPIGIYFLQNPDYFMSRMSSVSIFSQPNLIKVFAESLIKHLGMFNVYGDSNWRHNFSGSPMLPWPLGILFLIGIIFSIKETIFTIKDKDYPRLVIYLFLMSWFFALLLPGALTYEGIPHALRVIGVIPMVYILVSLGFYFLYEELVKMTKKRRLFLALFSLLFILVGLSEFNKYFFSWAENPNVKGAFTENYLKIGNYLNSLPAQAAKYVIVNEPGVPVPYPNGIPMPAQTPMFIEKAGYGETRSTYLLPEEIGKIKISKETFIVLMKGDKALLDKLKGMFPEAEIK